MGDFGDLFVGQLFQLAQHQWLPQFDRQRRYKLAYLPLAARLDQRRLRIVAAGDEIVRRDGAGFGCRGDRDQLRSAIERSGRIGRVAHDLQEPAAWVDALEARKIGQRAQHGFLQDVLGRGGVAHQPPGEVVRSIEMRQHDRFERVAWQGIRHVTNPADQPMPDREPSPSGH